VVLPVSLLSQIYHYVVLSQIHYLKQKKLEEQTKEGKLLLHKSIQCISGWELTAEIYNVIFFIYQYPPTKVILLT
jgi:hypothetical protein